MPTTMLTAAVPSGNLTRLSLSFSVRYRPKSTEVLLSVIYKYSHENPFSRQYLSILLPFLQRMVQLRFTIQSPTTSGSPGISRTFNRLHPWNTHLPIIFTDSGSLTYSSCVHLKNALSLIFSSPLGRCSSVKPF